MVNLLIKLLNAGEIETLINSVQKIAEVQNAQKSEWSVNGAAFIVTAIFCIILIGGLFGLLIRSILNQQKQLTSKVLDNKDLLCKFQESFDKNTEVLDKVSSYLVKVEEVNTERAKREVTKEQLYYLIQNSLNASKFSIISSVWKVIEQNNIKDTTKTKKKITNLINNIYDNLISGLNNFDFKGEELGKQIDFIQDAWKEKEIQIMVDFIYSPEQNFIKFSGDLSLIFETFFSEVRQKMLF